MTFGVGMAGLATAADLPVAQLSKQRRGAPDVGKAAGLAHITGGKFRSQQEWTGVDLADRIHAADDAARAAQVQAFQRLTVSREVEKGIAGWHFGMRQQPLI